VSGPCFSASVFHVRSAIESEDDFHPAATKVELDHATADIEVSELAVWQREADQHWLAGSWVDQPGFVFARQWGEHPGKLFQSQGDRGDDDQWRWRDHIHRECAKCDPGFVI
jgi:hypothetical protein